MNYNSYLRQRYLSTLSSSLIGFGPAETLGAARTEHGVRQGEPLGADGLQVDPGVGVARVTSRDAQLERQDDPLNPLFIPATGGEVHLPSQMARGKPGRGREWRS